MLSFDTRCVVGLDTEHFGTESNHNLSCFLLVAPSHITTHTLQMICLLSWKGLVVSFMLTPKMLQNLKNKYITEKHAYIWLKNNDNTTYCLLGVTVSKEQGKNLHFETKSVAWY